jgi:hypothetical protein
LRNSRKIILLFLVNNLVSNKKEIDYE